MLVSLILITLGWIFNYAHRMAVSPLLPMIKAEFHLSNAQAGLLMTALLLPYALIQVPAGYLGDRFGRKRLLALSIFGYSISSAMLFFASQYWEVLAFRALYGFFSGLYYAPATALIAETYGARKGSALGVFMLGPPVGSGIVPLLVVPVALNLGWRYAFPILAVMSLTVGVLLVISLRTLEERSGKARLSIEVGSVNLAIANFLALMAFFGVLTFLVAFLTSTGMGVEKASYLFSLLSLVGIAGSLTGGVLYDRLGRKALELAFLSNALLIVLLVLKPGFLSALVLGLTFYSVGPMVTAFTAETARKDNLGPVMGFVNMVGFFGATVGPYFTGWLIDRLGYREAFFAIAVLYALAWSVIKGTKRAEKVSRT
ncbi:Permeases of the major facilitator superfamily [Thermococcus nautili]|uniref:MFS transporter n=1 Tax=Thermococcus nautili TaxID=195522 RepID=UPI00255306F9|nr:MFS transporter [Thermococcus nautili]CAI1492970.1 Permeases of the major facilitator superfamily [Thermococcus nautili]